MANSENLNSMGEKPELSSAKHIHSAEKLRNVPLYLYFDIKKLFVNTFELFVDFF
jgi:hypothetical protein